MNKIYFKACWLIILLMMPWLVYAAGLGKLTLGSSLGQPLKVEIELVSVIEDEIPSLTARVASSEAFRQAGITYVPYHSSFVVSVEKRVNGQPYIQITSPHSINEPFVNLLIELDGSSGRLLREYTVLLDPAETSIVESAVPIAQQAPDSLQTTSRVSGVMHSQASVNQNSEANGAPVYRQEPSTYGPVVQGDTLTKIARQVSPEGVDLNRMLVSLYQANQNAFFEKNMNLLKVGVILRIPDQNEISAISQREANLEIKAQTANWHAYRLSVAEAAMGALPKTESQQSAAGRITTTIEEENPVIKNVPSEEVLILSKGESFESYQVSNNSNGEKTVTTQEYLRMMEEDAIAKERALNEASERVALLEQNIERLRRLLEIKGAGVTDAQIQAKHPFAQLDPALPSASLSDEVEAVPVDSIDLSVADERDHAEKSEVILPAQSVILEQTVNQGAPLPDSSEPIESALLDHIVGFVTDNLVLVGAALAVLLAGFLGLSFLRQRRERSDEMDDVFDYPEEAPQGSGKTSAGIAEIAPTETIILGDNAQTKKKESALGSAEDAKFFKSEGPKGNLSESASGFFFGKNINENLVADQNANSDNELIKSGFDQVLDPIDEPEREINDLKNTIDFSDASTDYGEVGGEPEMLITKNEPTPDLEFTLNLEVEQADNENTSFDEKGMPFSIDFSEDIKASSDSVTALDAEVESLSRQDDEQPLTQFNLSDIKLDLDDETEKTSKDDIPAEAVSTLWDEIAVKVDLAKAYLDMDDKEGAREILKEVIREGNKEQQAIAQSMLEGLK